MIMETKVCSSCKSCKSTLEFHKSSRTKSGLHSQCKTCTSEYGKKYYQKNSEARKMYDSKYRKENADTVSAAKQRYQQNNRGKVNAHNRKRKACKIQRTPNWLTSADLFEIECIYNYCAALRSVGLNYEVDHIVPLRGKHVSGLHVPSNLAVLPMIVNRKKYNRFEDSHAN